MNIRDEAIEAAAKAIAAHNGERFDLMARAVLEAVAPYIAAEALEDAAEWLKQPSEPRGGFAYWWLNEKADTYRKGRVE